MTSATSDVKAAVENLEEKSGMNFLLIGGIAAGVIVVVVVIIIIVVSSTARRKRKHRQETEMFLRQECLSSRTEL